MAKVEQQGLVAAELEENKILWKHENPESTQIWKFMRDVERRRGLKFEVSA